MSASYLILSFIVTALVAHTHIAVIKASPPTFPPPLPSISNLPQVNITTPSIQEQIKLGIPIAISGYSSDDKIKDCQVYVIVNNVKPYQKAIAVGDGGANDYSKWNYLLSSNYTVLKEGPNRITSKVSCGTDSVNSTKWYSINVTGISNPNLFSPPSSRTNNITTNIGEKSILPQIRAGANNINSSGNPLNSSSSPQASLEAPIADAGSDQVISKDTTISLDGSASKDPDGRITSYSWIQVSGNPIITLNNAGSPSPSFQAPLVKQDTQLTFRLTVVDNDRLSDSDSVKVTVKNTGPDNQRTSKDETPCDQIGITNKC